MHQLKLKEAKLMKQLEVIRQEIYQLLRHGNWLFEAALA